MRWQVGSHGVADRSSIIVTVPPGAQVDRAEALLLMHRHVGQIGHRRGAMESPATDGGWTGEGLHQAGQTLSGILVIAGPIDPPRPTKAEQGVIAR